MKNYLIISIILVIFLTGCEKLGPTFCTKIGCISTIRISFNNFPNEIDSADFKIKTDLIPEVKFSTNPTEANIGDGFNGLNFDMYYDEGGYQLHFLIMPKNSNTPDFKNSKKISFSYSDTSIAMDTVFNLDFDPRYPNGYECDKDHPCWMDRFELDYEK